MPPDIRVRQTVTEANSTRAAQRAASIRTALILALVAVGFFGAILAAQFYGPSMIGLGALGVAVIGFPLAVVVGRGRAR
jgi:protein-S-isoprenylcysteine O-methyltransferase Ste14